MSEVKAMARNYVEGDSVRFTLTGLCTVDMDVYGGETVKELTPKRLFPMTGEGMYISLLDGDGKEVAIIRSLDTLMPDSRKAIEEALGEYYFMPKITAINGLQDKFGILRLDVQTDKGRVSFDIKNRHYDIKKIYGNRILIRDRDDNRYEIPDCDALDKRSLKLLYPYI